MTGRMMRPERSARKRMSSTAAAVSSTLSSAPSATVANSSSAMATGPVRRTVTPLSGVSPSVAAVARIVSDAAAPGSSAP